jgi:hypothetical protein
VCESCDSLALTIERQEAWTCVPCGHATRSWWRTSSAPGDAVEVVARRLSAAAAAERARVRAGMRQRRWKIVTGAFVGLIVVAVFVVAVRAAEPTQVGGTRATCEHFERLRADLSARTARTVGPARLNSQLDALTAKSATADASVQKAVVDLAAAGRPGQASFLVAETNLADACAAAPRR